MRRLGLGWNAELAQQEAQDMFDRIFHMKFLPPGRGLWAMGTPITRERKLFAALNNCAFVSTEDMAEDPVSPFTFLMDASMLGVGVGFDTKGAGSVIVLGPSKSETTRFVVPDSREGWVESVELLLNSYFRNTGKLTFDYSEIRPAGAPIRGFGGTSQGPDILRELHQAVSETLDALIGKPITVTVIVDIMNLIGRCVVAGNVRRTAEIAFGDPNSDEYISLKDYDVNPRRANFGWLSNNSVYATLGMNYEKICEKVRQNGEPGFAWLDNMQQYGRMADPPNFKDRRAKGGNPCLEQTLESYEMCCLVETFPAKHDSFEDFVRTLRSAFLYAKTVTLGSTHWKRTNEVMLRNRRIGCSMSGIAQFISHKGMGELQRWCDKGYTEIQTIDKELSERFAVPQSIKTTSIKPSGTVSLLAGATPGMHFPFARHYIRRVRFAANSDLLPAVRAANYPIEPAVGDPHTVVVEIPIDAGANIRTVSEVTMWEQLALASLLQRYWSDNQVSCTVTFDPETEGPQLAHALDLFQYQLKGVSFLPRLPEGAYAQMPYEAISEQEYLKRKAAIKSLRLGNQKGALHEEMPDKFCDAAGCTIDVHEVQRSDR